jgi:hypothetical protein
LLWEPIFCPDCGQAFVYIIRGPKRSYGEFYMRVIDGATALGSPVSVKGLALKGEDGEVVGILGKNYGNVQLNLVEWAIALHGMYESTSFFVFILQQKNYKYVEHNYLTQI